MEALVDLDMGPVDLDMGPVALADLEVEDSDLEDTLVVTQVVDTLAGPEAVSEEDMEADSGEAMEVVLEVVMGADSDLTVDSEAAVSAVPVVVPVEITD